MPSRSWATRLYSVVVGHLNSGVAIPSSEEYHNAQLAMVSPANTNPLITTRGYPEVNRIVGRDDVQGVVGAEFANSEMGVKSVYVLHDKTAYGQGVAEFFRQKAEELGMAVLGFEGTEEQANFDSVLTPILAANPDLVYFGGIYSQGGLILKQMREKGINGAVPRAGWSGQFRDGKPGGRVRDGYVLHDDGWPVEPLPEGRAVHH
jgi:branched-chain amino acid transport system substrate-binding protein